MTLFGRIIALFHREDIPCALIGASALAVHGIPRSTYDLDLLTTSPRALEPSLWEQLSPHDMGVDVRAGDAADPLRGVVGLQRAGDRDVDVVSDAISGRETFLAGPCRAECSTRMCRSS